MKSLLIRIGKAWNVLMSDGLWSGGRRILSSFLKLFRRVEPGDILFITNGVGDTSRYRAHHVAEELNLHGFKASVTIQDNPFLSSYADQFSVFVFHRTLASERILNFVEKLKDLKKEIIFDADDLLFDREYLVHMDYYRNLNALEKPLFENGLGSEILNDSAVKVATATTRFLARKFREKGKEVILVPNRLSLEDCAWAEEILKNGKKKEDEVRLGYMSGTPSHDKDFATIAPVLARLLEKYPNLHLSIVGPLSLDPTLDLWKERIERKAFLPRRDLFQYIGENIDINLAPLEIGNPFCESKSELKFFEAGIVGVPTVAAATETFLEAIREGEDGYVAANTEDWEQKLTRLIENPDLREHTGEKARETALARYTTKNADNREYYNYLNRKMV